MPKLSDLGPGPTKFAIEYARSLLVDWARQCVLTGSFTVEPKDEFFLEVARDRGWINKRPPLNLSSKGYTAATGFLKR